MTDTSKYAVDRLVISMINSGNTTTANMLTALAVERDAANARAGQARDAALVEAAARFPDSRQPWPPHAIRKAILALRDKPAPAVTVQTKPCVWPSCGHTARYGCNGCLRAIAGGRDE